MLDAGDDFELFTNFFIMFFSFGVFSGASFGPAAF